MKIVYLVQRYVICVSEYMYIYGNGQHYKKKMRSSLNFKKKNTIIYTKIYWFLDPGIQKIKAFRIFHKLQKVIPSLPRYTVYNKNEKILFYFL